MPLKPCLVCGRLSPRSRCPRHGQPNRTGAPISERDRREFRERVVSTGRCQRCGAGGVPLEANHVQLLSEGGEPPGVGVSVCPRCHDELHRARDAVVGVS
jgi:hypothetical protein